MDERTQQPSSSGAQATQKEPPPRDTIVRQKRLNPHKLLEEKVRQRIQREAEAARPGPEQMQPAPPTTLGRDAPTMLAPVQVPESKYAPPQKPPRRGAITKENALTAHVPRTDLAGGERSSRICCTDLPSKSAQPNDGVSPLRYRIVMPKRFSPHTALREKMRRRVEKEAESTTAPRLDDQTITQNLQRPVTQYADHPRELNVPQHLPRRQLTVTLGDFTTSQLQDSYQKNSGDTQPSVQKTIIPVTTRPRSWSAVDFYEPITEERPLVQKNIPPPKPARKRLIKPEVGVEQEQQLFSDEAAATQVSDYSLQWKQPAEMLYDEFCTSASVARLSEDNYKEFLGDKRSALVMFYKPWKQSCVKGRKHFVKVNYIYSFHRVTAPDAASRQFNNPELAYIYT